MELTVQNICGLLIRSRLLTPEEVKKAFSRWQHEAGDLVANLAQFLKWLVARGYVTEYQASLLAKGHADDFFLKEYKILERIGRGRMAGVYKAMHHLGQTVAIKVLPPSKAKNPQFLGRFQREARLALQLKHPNIVRSFQLGETNGLNYLVMEHLIGDTLEEILQRRKRLPVGEAVRIIHHALTGLQHIHEKGMVHRDLKPANLMLAPPPSDDSEGSTLKSNVKILDIGLGRELFDESQPDKDSNLTGEGVLLGTPDYLAPEQARDPRTIDIRADIYSLGCVLYHCLTGQPPFPDKNLLTQMVRHATEAPKPMRTLAPTVPEGLDEIVIDYMLAKEPAKRYPTPARAAAALQLFLLAESESSSMELPPQLGNFLTWLEAEGKSAEPAQAVPAAATAAPPARLAKTAPPFAKPVVAIPQAMPVDMGADVELLPVEPAAAARKLGLSKREWVLVGITAGTLLVIAAIIVIVLMSRE